jgi:hypothetical protein
MVEKTDVYIRHKARRRTGESRQGH